MIAREYNSLIIGPVSLDIMIDYKDIVEKLVGGAVIQSAYAASNIGYKIAVFTKLNQKDLDVYKAFKDCDADIYWYPSKETTSIKNKYFTKNQEKRDCHLLSKSDGFKYGEFSGIKAKIYHFAGLTVGDFDNELIKQFSKKGKVAVDVQCLLRKVTKNKQMLFEDWKEKKEYLPYIDFLKTDAAEAEILTGTTDREQAAKILFEWGAKEIMITHNKEVLIYDGEKVYKCPIKARSLVGRTGRGDTTFAGYINSRLTMGIEKSLIFATALVSLKMESKGPFRGKREDVENYIKEFYN